MEKYKYNDEEFRFMENSGVPFGIYQVIEDRIYTIVLTKGFLNFFGYADMPREEVYQMLNNDLFIDVHPDDREIVKGIVDTFNHTHQDYNAVYRIKIKGEYHMIHAFGKRIVKDDGTELVYAWYNLEDEAYQKLEELRKSIADLLTNMPAMTFSKDVNSRKYIACNQAFADYAHKETPEGVVGLTDFEIFDKDTANHFIEDDKKALSMDKPYIFFEDVPDAAGNMRQFQTTKLRFTDNKGRDCLLGLCQDVTDAMRIKREYAEKLEQVQSQASVDALTGIKNKNAYQQKESIINQRIMARRQSEFAITVLDVNNLKEINDTLGHKAGDECICTACRVICKIFKRSPVYRIGGDEFAVISVDEDYENIDELIDTVAKHNEDAVVNGGVVIACGCAKYTEENSMSEVFNKADKNMYENKTYLKQQKN